ncbi:MAG: PAS domain S-box protein, partial [Desulfobacteraceae bacterium]|nr:PAS domain S-box protein [Desulfobacteraceae bacterium]
MHTVKAKMFQRMADLCRPAIQLTGGIIVILDLDGKIISFNELLESTTGYSYSELLQKNWFDLFFSGKEKIAAKRYFRRYLLKGDAPAKIVTKIITRAAQDCFIEWHYSHFEDEASGDVTGLLAIGRDVSARVRHEKQLLSERNQLIERNKELTCLYSMAKIVGRNTPLSQMLESIAAIIPPAFQYPKMAAAAIRLDQNFYGVRRPLKDSPALSEPLVINQIPRGHVQVVYLPSKTVSQKRIPPFLEEEHALLKSIAHHLALAIEKKEALDNQAEMETQLRHSDRLAKIGQLTAGVAHELNEPLGNILGLAQLSSKTAGLSAQVQH